MANWESIDSAPKDLTWIKVRGHDYGDRTRRRHYAIAFYENDNWNEVGSEGGLLYYLDGWQPLSNPHGEVKTGPAVGNEFPNGYELSNGERS